MGDPSQTPTGPSTKREESPILSRKVLIYTALALCGLFFSFSVIPWNFLGMIAAIAAVIYGIRLLATSWSSLGTSTSVTVIITMLIVGFGAVVALSSLIYIGPQIEYQRCMAEAVTIKGQDQCLATFQKAQQDVIDRLPISPFLRQPTDAP